MCMRSYFAEVRTLTPIYCVETLFASISFREVWVKTAFVGKWVVKFEKISVFLAYLSFYAFYDLDSTCVVKP